MRNSYRVAASPVAAGEVASRLDRITRERLGDAFEEALDAAFGGDRAVYVMRRVEARVLLYLGEEATDAVLARRWAGELAKAVARGVSKGAAEGRSENVIRFDSRADYVAHFVAAALAGTARGRWYFAEFERLRHLETAEALRRVLLEDRAELPAVLGLLHERRQLEALLDALPGAARRALWREGLSHAPRHEPSAAPTSFAESLRPIFSGALRLVGELDAWAGARPGDAELFESYLDDAPRAADWRDRRGLAVALLDVLRFFAGRGYLRRRGAPDESFPALLDRAVEGLDWLDVEWLRDALSELLGGSEAGEAHVMPGRSRDGPTPRQRELLRTLAALVGDGAVPLGGRPAFVRESGVGVGESVANFHGGAAGEQGGPDADADALRLFAALISREPRWAEDALAETLIQSLLSARDALARADDPAGLMRRLRRGDTAGALSTLPEAERVGAASALKLLAGIRGEALDLLDRLAGVAADETTARAVVVESDCAGVSLLLRTMLDVRLHALAESAECPAGGKVPRFAALLCALGLRLGGEEWTRAGRVDEGLSMLAGMEIPATREELREAWAGTSGEGYARFQRGLLRTLYGQRLLNASAVHLFRVRLACGATALVAGDATAHSWVLGKVVADGDEVEPVVAEWLDAFASAGARPSSVIADESLAAPAWTLRAGASLEVVFAPDAESDNANGDGGSPAEGEKVRALEESGPAAAESGEPEPLAAHAAGRAALLVALESLGRGRTGSPEADLTVALTACLLLRAWARWLKQFSGSSVPYLLGNFIRRPGRLSSDRRGLLIGLKRKPLDIVVEMAGYLAELECVPWLAGGRRVRFSLWGE